MESLKMMAQIISDTEQHVTSIEPIRIAGRKTVLGYRIATRKLVSRGDYVMDYGYVGPIKKEAYLPKKTLRIDWEVAKRLLEIKDIFN